MTTTPLAAKLFTMISPDTRATLHAIKREAAKREAFAKDFDKA